MTTHCSTLAWRIPQTEEPGGLQFTGSHRIRHDGRDLAYTQAREETHASEDHPEKKKYFQGKVRAEGDLRFPPQASEPKT